MLCAGGMSGFQPLRFGQHAVPQRGTISAEKENINTLRAIKHGEGIFSIDMYALRAMRKEDVSKERHPFFIRQRV
jgi:hypothetical protein